MPIIATPPRLHTTAIIIVLLPPETNKTHIINHLKAMVTLLNSAVWPVPYACTQPYHPGSGRPINLGDPRLHTHCTRLFYSPSQQLPHVLKELALKGVHCTRLGSRGSQHRDFLCSLTRRFFKNPCNTVLRKISTRAVCTNGKHPGFPPSPKLNPNYNFIRNVSPLVPGDNCYCQVLPSLIICL